MRIIILTAIPFWHPGTLELITNLRKRGLQVSALDIFHGKSFTDKNEIKNELPFGLTGLAARIYLKIFRKSFTRKHTVEADILDIHFIEPAYAKYLNGLRNKIICTLFGSDLFRTTQNKKDLQKSIFARANKIVLSENMVDTFNEFFPGNSSKFYFNQYGSDRIDQIIAKKKVSNSSLIKRQLGIPDEYVVITCGYNAKVEQQHLRMIQQINELPSVIKEKIFLVFPMTYGDGDLEYIEMVEKLLVGSKLAFRILRERLSDEELVQYRLASDISINTQTTDALASSIKEAMVAGDIMLIGNWLPYEIYKELGVFYIPINFESLKDEIISCFTNFSELRIKSETNESIIKNFATWEVLTDKWVQLYKTTYIGS